MLASPRVRLVVLLMVAVVGPGATIALGAPAGAAEPACGLLPCVLGPAPAAAPAPAPPSPPPTPTATAPVEAPAQPARIEATPARLTAQLLDLLDHERTSRGLPPFTRRADVDGIAAAWSGHMADAGALSHNDGYFTSATHRRLGARLLGENVAHAQDAAQAHDFLMNSHGHRANILNPQFTQVGLGAELRDGSWWITEDFVQPDAERPAPALAPASPRVAAVRPVVATRVTAPVADVELRSAAQPVATVDVMAPALHEQPIAATDVVAQAPPPPRQAAAVGPALAALAAVGASGAGSAGALRRRRGTVRS